MQLNRMKYSRMQNCGVLLCCLSQTALSFGFHEAQLHSQIVDETELKFLQVGLDTNLAGDELRQQAMTLQQDAEKGISQLSSGYMGVQPEEDVAVLAHTGTDRNDIAIFAELAANMESTHKDTKASGASEILAEDGTEDVGVVPHRLTRPNVGKKPEEVSFGLFAKTFYGVNLKANNFVIDVVMTLKWIDKRVALLIPEGVDTLTLSKMESERKIWLPGMVITNRDIKKYDLISTAVFINRKGEVFKVERATAVVKNKYVLDDFPFDEQKLVVKIASAKYMINDVVLKPMEDGSGIGVKEGLLDGESYSFVDVSATAFKDVDGALKKSRGVLTITIKRDLDKYTQSHIVPSALVTAISWAVFWFPFVAPFITPRLAMSILSLLTFTNLTLKSGAALPPGAPFNWNDVFNRTIMTIMFTTVILNILSEICLHQLKIDDTARRINHELKVVMPCLTISSLILVLSAAGRDGWMGLGTTSVVVNGFIVSVVGSYLAFTVPRMVSAMAKKKVQGVAQAETPLLKK